MNMLLSGYSFKNRSKKEHSLYERMFEYILKFIFLR